MVLVVFFLSVLKCEMLENGAMFKMVKMLSERVSKMSKFLENSF